MTWFSLLVLGAASFGILGFYLGFWFPNRKRRVKEEWPDLESWLFPVVFATPLYLWLAYTLWAPAAIVVASGLFFGAFTAGCYYYRVNRTKVIGITGTIGSGKSLVGKLLAEEGMHVIDTDHVVHELLRSDPHVHRLLRARFGDDIFLPVGGIDRKKLRFVFQDAAAKKDLEAILHPRVRQTCRELIAQRSGDKWVAVQVPLLFEAKLESEYDEIWTVVARDEVVRERLKKRDGLTDAEVDLRLKAQFPQAEKARRSHRVLDNSGTIDDTRALVKQVLRQLDCAV